MMPRQHVIQRSTSQFWTGHDWADALHEAAHMTLDEAMDVIEHLAHRSPHTLHVIKDYGKAWQSVLCTA